MATLLELRELWYQGSALRAKFEGALITAAAAIINEDPGTANHANRLVYANALMADEGSALSAAAKAHTQMAIATNATIQAAGNAADDSDVQFVCNSQIDTFATGS